MKNLFFLFAFLFPVLASAQNSQLLGVFARTQLEQEPYAGWYTKNYNDYMPNAEIIKQLKSIDLNSVSIELFLGTWCGDSHREVPRFLKLLDDMNFPQQAITLVGLSNADSIYKQSPTHEEQGKNIYRVPTFIILKNGKEINRIVEYPVTSLERDLLAILKNEDYTPNYQSYAYLSKYFDNGLLTDDNVSLAGLANPIRHLVRSSGELNNYAYVMARQKGNMNAAVKIFRMNCFLFPDNHRTYASLSEALGETGEHTQAEKMLQKALELNTDPKNVKYLMELHDVVRDRIE